MVGSSFAYESGSRKIGQTTSSLLFCFGWLRPNCAAVNPSMEILAGSLRWFGDGRGSFRGPWDPLKVDEKPQRIPQNPVRSFWMDRNPEDSRNSPTEPFEMDKNPGRIPQNPLKILENLQESRNKSLKILQKCFQICKNPSTSHQIPWKSFQICKNPSKSFKKNPFKSRRIPQNPSKSFQINKNPKVSLKILF